MWAWSWLGVHKSSESPFLQKRFPLLQPVWGHSAEPESGVSREACEPGVHCELTGAESWTGGGTRTRAVRSIEEELKWCLGNLTGEVPAELSEAESEGPPGAGPACARVGLLQRSGMFQHSACGCTGEERHQEVTQIAWGGRVIMWKMAQRREKLGAARSA